MKIMAYKSFQFDHPQNGEEPVVVQGNRDITTVPDWVADSLMFKYARADGDIMVIENRQDEAVAETGGSSNKRKNATSADNSENTTSTE